MKVTVIGAGNMGSAFVRQLVGAGHQVSVAARDAAKAAHVAAAHPGAVAVPAAGAAQGADVVVVATGYADAVAALRTADVQAGQTVIDITNPLTADFDAFTFIGSNAFATQFGFHIHAFDLRHSQLIFFKCTTTNGLVIFIRNNYMMNMIEFIELRKERLLFTITCLQISIECNNKRTEIAAVRICFDERDHAVLISAVI